MKIDAALHHAKEFLRLYWANEHAHEAWSRQLEQEHNLTAKQYALLRAVERKADITTSDLTVLLGKAQPAITQMLNRLESAGYILREQNPHDKRKREVRLTDKARKLLQTVEPVGATRVALCIEHATEREASEVTHAMQLLHEWMTKRRIRAT